MRVCTCVHLAGRPKESRAFIRGVHSFPPILFSSIDPITSTGLTLMQEDKNAVFPPFISFFPPFLLEGWSDL